MRRDFDLNKQNLGKAKLDTLGHQFILDSQYVTLQNLSNKVNEESQKHATTMKKVLFDKEKGAKDTNKVRFGLEADLRQLDDQLKQEGNLHYDSKMTLDKNEQFGALNSARQIRDQKLSKDWELKETDERDQLVQKRDKERSQFMGMSELQTLINDATKFKTEIEEMHIQIQFLSIQIKSYEDLNNCLVENKEKMDEEKQRVDLVNEDLAKQQKAKEETNQKRLISKIQRDKTPAIKDLINKEEQQ